MNDSGLLERSFTLKKIDAVTRRIYILTVATVIMGCATRAGLEMRGSIWTFSSIRIAVLIKGIIKHEVKAIYDLSADVDMSKCDSALRTQLIVTVRLL